MQKPPSPPGDDGSAEDGFRARTNPPARQDNPFGRSFHRPETREARSHESLQSDTTRIDERISGEDLFDKMPAGFEDLARRVAETNQLIDLAVSSIAEDSTQPFSVESIAELGENLNLLFSQLQEGLPDSATSPWHIITDALHDMSSKIVRREELRAELKLTQQSIDKAKLRLIDQIHSVAKQEQERLSVTRMRSRLATVMAEKLLNKLC
jgi:hypothetical protein